MTTTIIRFITLLLVALLVGTMFGIMIGFNPAEMTPATYVEQQQHAIRALNTLMPLWGAACIILTIVLAILAKEDRPKRYMLLTAAACLIVAGAVTRFGNQPINSVVMTWTPQTPPSNWMELRNLWWQWHI
jgi:glucan phosphoethanolaminetransferase (alkaline phosphatase superfamily)